MSRSGWRGRQKRVSAQVSVSHDGYPVFGVHNGQKVFIRLFSHYNSCTMLEPSSLLPIPSFLFWVRLSGRS